MKKHIKRIPKVFMVITALVMTAVMFASCTLTINTGNPSDTSGTPNTLEDFSKNDIGNSTPENTGDSSSEKGESSGEPEHRKGPHWVQTGRTAFYFTPEEPMHIDSLENGPNAYQTYEAEGTLLTFSGKDFFHGSALNGDGIDIGNRGGTSSVKFSEPAASYWPDDQFTATAITSVEPLGEYGESEMCINVRFSFESFDDIVKNNCGGRWPGDCMLGDKNGKEYECDWEKSQHLTFYGTIPDNRKTFCIRYTAQRGNSLLGDWGAVWEYKWVEE